jgi:carbonic anhydrase/acetyltransferase-like protein (isoleucine patch superfamily)
MNYPFAEFQPVVHETAFVAPTAVLIGQVTVAEGASIWFHSVARGDINLVSIGANTNIQDGCMLHVTQRNPLLVDERVTAGHGAILHACHIESDCLIAMGAIVLDGAKVGAGSIVAAGAVVAPGTIIPPASLVMGVPGKVVRPVNAEDRSRIEQGWQNYIRYSAIYRGMNLV